MSIARRSGVLVYNHYFNNGYDIYKARSEAFINAKVNPQDVDFKAATLPHIDPETLNIVDAQLHRLDQRDPAFILAKEGKGVDTKSIPYEPKFELIYIGGSAGVGINNNNLFGTNTGLAGGIDMLFSDILGNSQLFTSLALNGEITDFGGLVGYFNRKHKISYGAALSHIPFRQIAGIGIGLDSLRIGDDLYQVLRLDYDIIRRFEDRAEVFAQIAFSKSMRLETSASFSRFSFRRDLIKTYYDFAGFAIGQDREKIDAPEGFNLGTAGIALVGDKSIFGLTAPLKGYRYRMEIERYFGAFNFNAITSDLRTYKYLKPVGLAFRALHYGRYGNPDNRLTDLYVGNSWYVRGYDFGNTQDLFFRNGKDLGALFGNKILVSNFEVRLPLSGPKQLALIKSGFFFTDLNFFVDGGVAWDSFDEFRRDSETGQQGIDPIFSVGTSVRLNLLGSLILEPYYAFPLENNARGVFGINLIPGW